MKKNKQLPQRISGMPCPNCKNFVPISMYQLLESKSIFCPTCGLRLDIGNDKKLLKEKILEEK